MTAPPSWSPGDQDAPFRQGLPEPEHGSVPFRNLLGLIGFAPTAVGPGAPAGMTGLRVDPAWVSLQFTISPLTVMVETARGDLQQRAESAGKQLRRRGYTVGPVSPADVVGYGGLSRIVTAKKRGKRPAGQPVIQLYTIVGPYALTLSVPQAMAGFERTIGQIGLFPPVSPVITPIVRISKANPNAVTEKIVITREWVKLTALVSPGQVSQSTDEFAMTSLNQLRSRLPDLAVDNWQPDVFLGSQPCVRDTFLRGGVNRSDPVRSEYWWAGVVNGRGIQLFASATKSIISLDEARPFRDVVVLLPPD
jgi:hypothetical protein